MTPIPGLPPVRAGMCIGLLGGSFDPPHQGHVHITIEALKRFGLDEGWWLVSPGNPLKAHGPAPLAKRMAAARSVMQHPRVRVTDIEARLGTRFTFKTLEALFHRYPGVRFVWLMGADTLAQFHRWKLRNGGERIPAHSQTKKCWFRGLDFVLAHALALTLHRIGGRNQCRRRAVTELQMA